MASFCSDYYIRDAEVSRTRKLYWENDGSIIITGKSEKSVGTSGRTLKNNIKVEVVEHRSRNIYVPLI
jgi:hypothetical protein